jgi:hypothetical protein
MKFTCEVDCDNAAFYEVKPTYELARILTRVNERIVAGDFTGPCVDYNGETVGRWELAE